MCFELICLLVRLGCICVVCSGFAYLLVLLGVINVGGFSLGLMFLMVGGFYWFVIGLIRCRLLFDWIHDELALLLALRGFRVVVV